MATYGMISCPYGWSAQVPWLANANWDDHQSSQKAAKAVLTLGGLRIKPTVPNINKEHKLIMQSVALQVFSKVSLTLTACLQLLKVWRPPKIVLYM